MGTSSSYEGSGGQDWNDLRKELDNWLDNLPGGSDASPDDGGEDTEPPLSNGQRQPDAPDPEILRVLEPLRRAILAGARGSAISSTRVGIGRRGRSPSGTGRSWSRVGRVGGRLAVGISGIRSGDASALQSIGLNLDELEALNPYRQAQRLLEAATEETVATTLEEEELQTAAIRTAIWGLDQQEAPSVEDIVRQFIGEYVYQVFLMEGGSVLRRGQRDGVATRTFEERVRDTIMALSRTTSVDQVRLDAVSLADATERVLSQAMEIHGGDM